MNKMRVRELLCVLLSVSPKLTGLRRGRAETLPSYNLEPNRVLAG